MIWNLKYNIQNNSAHLILNRTPSTQSTLGKTSKWPQGNSNVLFDEIDGLEHILKDLCIQGASNPRDYRLVRYIYQGPVLKCRFKVDSDAASNLLP